MSVAVAEQLCAGVADAAGRHFAAWRIKNTHHPDAVVRRRGSREQAVSVVGGYRDVKVLGKFTASDLAMVVEIQVIDTTFLEVKCHMHKPFTIRRGDFW